MSNKNKHFSPEGWDAKQKSINLFPSLVIPLLVLIFFISLAYASTFTDNTQSNFNNGTYFQTFYNSSGFVQLNATNTTGNFTSQIFNAGGNATWNNISWFTEVPYNQELPNNQAVETGDFLRGANMAGNVLLMHMNEASGTIEDTSGNGNNGTANGGVTYNVSGKLNTALSFDGVNNSIDIGNSNSLNPTQMTFSSWVYINGSNANYGALLTRWGTGGNAYFIGTLPNSYAVAIYFSGTLRYTTPALPTGEWVHFLVTNNGFGNTVSYYQNGVYVGGGASGGGITSSTAPSSIGYDVSRTNYPFNGKIDEVAIYNRSLSATEILDIYKRGALKLNLSVQNCNDASCSGESWTNLGNNLTSPQNLSVANNAYFQYKYEFETDNASYSPELYNVSLDYTQLADPVVNISLVYPTTNISVYKNKFFNFTINVSCSSANCGGINVSLDPIKNDNTQSNFNNGTYFQTFYNSSGFVQLNATNTTGNFTSQIFNAGGNATWNNISWFTEVPYNQELPNNQAVETGDFLRGANMAGNVLLMHMNEASGTIEDTSGNGNNGTANGGVTYNVSGKLNTALSFDGTSSQINITGLNSTSKNYTFSFWVNSNAPHISWKYLADIQTGRFILAWDGATAGQLAFYDGNSWNNFGVNTFNDGVWHDVVFVFSGTSASLYVDGSQFGSTPTYIPQNLGGSISLGSNYAGTNSYFNGKIDEVAIYNRPLSATEILDIYKRGALKLNLSVQNCNDASCSGESWTNLGNNLTSPQNLSVANNAYFQYKYEFETDNASYSSELYNVSLDYTPVSSGKGLISTTTGATPFYTNATSNPLNISLNQGESQLVTFWVNSTGDYDTSYDFFAYANVTSNMSINDITQTLNLTIISNPISISNPIQFPASPTNYVGTYQFNITVSDYDGDYDTIYFSWNNGANQSVTTYANVSGGREYYHGEITPITGNNIPFSWFVNDSQGNTNTSSGTYTISAAQTSASLSLDKIISLQELNSTDIIYNITLRTTNKGGSTTNNVNLIDSDSGSSPYDLGNLTAENISSVSYLKTYTRNSTNYNVSLAIATVNGTDDYQGNETSANSLQIVLIVPASTANTTLTVLKNAEYLSENLTAVNYNLSINVINSGGTDLTGISIQDSDINLDTNINLNRTQTYSTSGTKSILKTSSNAEHLFEKANATYGSITYDSNELKVSIPSYGSSGNLYLIKSASLLETTNTNVTYNITLSLTNNGGRNLTSVEINDNNSASNPYSVGTLISGQEILRSYTKTFNRTTYASNQTLVSASANGTDAISGLVEITSGEIMIIISGTQTSASFVLDKIATIYNITDTTINYNVTLRLTNNGGSTATNTNITDSDSPYSPYDLGTMSNNEIVERRYIKNFTRQDTTTYQLLSMATAQGIDSYLNSLITVNSTELNVTVPDTVIGKQITITKNVVYSSENSTSIIYNVSSVLYNSGDEDLTSINYIDTDLNDAAFTININKGDSHLISKLVTLDKAASNTNHQFALGTSTISGLNFYSNRPTVRIPGYGGPADAIVYAPASTQASTSFDTAITVENQNQDIGQDFTINYWITNIAEDVNYTSGEQTIYVASSGNSNLTATLTSPSGAGDYRYRAIVTWAGGTATAFDTFSVTAYSTDAGTGDSSGGGGGGITGEAVEEVVCNVHYIRYGKECCLDENDNSICDSDETSANQGLKNKKGNSERNETTKKESWFFKSLRNVINNTSNFFSSVGKSVSQNENYFFIGFSFLIVLLGIISLILFIIKKRLNLLNLFTINKKSNDITKLKSTRGIQVYGADGSKIGKVKEIYLEEKKSKIYGWLIKVDKNISKKIKKKNILVRHKSVESIKHIMIIDKRISEHLEKLDSKIK